MFHWEVVIGQVYPRGTLPLRKYLNIILIAKTNLFSIGFASFLCSIRQARWFKRYIGTLVYYIQDDLSSMLIAHPHNVSFNNAFIEILIFGIFKYV